MGWMGFLGFRDWDDFSLINIDAYWDWLLMILIFEFVMILHRLDGCIGDDFFADLSFIYFFNLLADILRDYWISSNLSRMCFDFLLYGYFFDFFNELHHLYPQLPFQYKYKNIYSHYILDFYLWEIRGYSFMIIIRDVSWLDYFFLFMIGGILGWGRGDYLMLIVIYEGDFDFRGSFWWWLIIIGILDVAILNYFFFLIYIFWD